MARDDTRDGSVQNIRTSAVPVKILHHAYCLPGEKGERLSDARELVGRELGLSVNANPDVWQGVFDVFGIEEARDLGERASRRSLGGGPQAFVIAADRVTREAGNALLKLFEEPSPGTHFFVIVPSASSLLPTLLSRMEIIPTQGNVAPGADSDAEALARAFLTAPLSERLQIVAPLIARKDPAEARTFLHTLARILHGYFEVTSDALVARALAEISRCADYLGDRSPAVKMIMENIALGAPRFLGLPDTEETAVHGRAIGGRLF